VNLHVVCFALLALGACASTAPAVPQPEALRYETAMAEFAAADAAKPPPACSFLFVGSSSIRFWRTLQEDFPDRAVINRGFGGSTVAEVNWYFDRAVKPYRPQAIVFYAGENDLNAGKSPAQVYADFELFMRLKERALGSTPVWYISAKPSKLRLAQLPAQSDLNGRIRSLAAERDDLAYIDVVSAMLKADGTPKDIFVEDDLHMTPEGYAIWTPIVDAALDAGQTAEAPGC
jgi:lysophospholipase L1-like esterase